MSNTKHTPTPWFANRQGWSSVYIEARLRPGFLQEVAACGPTEAGPEQQDANADFIVRAANSHEQLVEALQLVMTWIDNWDPDFIHDPEWASDRAQIDAALAAAEAA